MRIDDVLSNACRLQGSLEHEDACPKGDVDSLSPHGPIQRRIAFSDEPKAANGEVAVGEFEAHCRSPVVQAVNRAPIVAMLRAAAALPNSGLSQQLDFHELGWLRPPSGGDAVPPSVVKNASLPYSPGCLPQ